MITPLARALARSHIRLQDVIALDIDEIRAKALLEGADPSIEEVRKIARRLNQSPRALISAAELQVDPRPNFRLNFGRDQHRQFEAEILIRNAVALAPFLHKKEAQRWKLEISTEEKVFRSAETLALFCRERILKTNSFDPLIDLERLCVERTSIYVILLPLRKIEGCALSSADCDFIFLARRGDARMRYTLAHEICHYLVDLPTEGAWFDDEISAPNGVDRLSERFANAFAAALLLPAAATASALKHFRSRYSAKGGVSDAEVVFLSRFFGVNFQVAAQRCETLKLLPIGGANALYGSVIKKFKSPEVLADRLGLPPRDAYNWGFGLKAALSTSASCRDQWRYLDWKVG